MSHAADARRIVEEADPSRLNLRTRIHMQRMREWANLNPCLRYDYVLLFDIVTELMGPNEQPLDDRHVEQWRPKETIDD